MPLDDSVTIQGQDELDAFLAQLSGENIVKALKPAMFNVGEALRGKMSVYNYPGRPSYPLKWASDKQRRWYFASRRASGAGLPYHRLTDPWSKQLGQSWRVSPHRDGYDVGTAVDYAPYVQSMDMQTDMHAATGWKTEGEAVREVEQSGLIAREVDMALSNYFRRLGGT